MKLLCMLLFMAICSGLRAQDRSLPYFEIPKEPENFTAGTVASRMIDGLGFRFYWATEGLRPEDFAFKPTKDSRTSEETIRHIYELSLIIVNSTVKKENTPGEVKVPTDLESLRKETLQNLKTASDKLRVASDKEMNEFKLVFKRDSGTREFPFWNQLNGPIADALWHVGQVVSFRRSSGNPFNDKANVFTGKVANNQ